MAPPPPPSSSPKKSRASSSSTKKTPRKIFTALKDASPLSTGGDTVSALSMGSALNALSRALDREEEKQKQEQGAPPAPPTSARGTTASALRDNLCSTLSAVSATQMSVNVSLNNVRAAKVAAANRRREATARLKAEREQEKAENLSFNESKRRLRMDLLKARGDAR